jgi:ATP phosphoribosyltransferase regulatory subunit
VTLDPTERHGFEYQSWFGFTIFAKGYSAALGRGGTYYIDRADGPSEPATGFSLYPDPLIDLADEGVVRRLFLPLGTDAATGAKMRHDGWVTVSALDENDSAAVLGCTHIWINGQAIPA